MLRTQISLTESDRLLLDAAAARTGRSVAALIRDAVQLVYARGRSAEQDEAALRSTSGAWAAGERTGSTPTGEQYVERLRSGRRLRRPE